MAVMREFKSKAVLGVAHATYDASCEGGSAVTGTIVDRLALGRHYNAVFPVVIGDGDIGTSTKGCHFASVEVKIQDSATTCAGGFSDYSTGFQVAPRAAFIINTATATATANSIGAGFLSTSTGLLSTSTGAMTIESGFQVYDLTAAERYLRTVLTPHLGTTSSGGPIMRMGATLVFGSPDESPYESTSTGLTVLTT